MSSATRCQATESQQPMDVTVALMDGQKFTLPMDSAFTSAEVIRDVAKKINLTDTYGFSLYISIHDKVLPVEPLSGSLSSHKVW